METGLLQCDTGISETCVVVVSVCRLFIGGRLWGSRRRPARTFPISKVADLLEETFAEDGAATPKRVVALVATKTKTQALVEAI